MVCEMMKIPHCLDSRFTGGDKLSVLRTGRVLLTKCLRSNLSSTMIQKIERNHGLRLKPPFQSMKVSRK
jgi:hypothetical protein